MSTTDEIRLAVLDEVERRVRALVGMDVHRDAGLPAEVGPREPFASPPGTITIRNGSGALVDRGRVLAILDDLRGGAA